METAKTETQYTVCEQGFGFFSLHIFRSQSQFRDWCRTGHDGIQISKLVPTRRVRGTRAGEVDHRYELEGQTEAEA